MRYSNLSILQVRSVDQLFYPDTRSNQTKPNQKMSIEFGSAVKEMTMSDKDGTTKTVRLVQVRNTPPINLWDDTPLKTEWGLSYYNADTKKKGDLDLILTPDLEARMRKVDAYVVEVGKEITRPYFKKSKPLEYRPLVSENEDRAPVLRVKVGEKTAVYTHDREVGTLQHLTRNSKCMVIAEYTTFWFTDTQYGVTLGCKALMVKSSTETSLDAFPDIAWD